MIVFLIGLLTGVVCTALLIVIFAAKAVIRFDEDEQPRRRRPHRRQTTADLLQFKKTAQRERPEQRA